MTQQICSSCNKEITNVQGSVHFACPQCGKHDIIRCTHCRKIVSKYTCPGCGFCGPN